MKSVYLAGTMLCGAVVALGMVPSASAQSMPAPATPDQSGGKTPDQTAGPAPQGDAQGAAQQGRGPGDVVVTGTRIARPGVTSPVPVTSVSAGELLSTGTVSVGDALNELPQLRTTFSQSNSTRFIGTAGISALDLRGLGTTRTLVLSDNRRIVTATPGVNRPDVNDIPDDLIERVDIVTGGNSAIYGSDAVAGVVNFVLKDNFDGVRARAQSGISSRGDRGSYFEPGVRSRATWQPGPAIGLRVDLPPVHAADAVRTGALGRALLQVADADGVRLTTAVRWMRDTEDAAAVARHAVPLCEGMFRGWAAHLDRLNLRKQATRRAVLQRLEMARIYLHDHVCRQVPLQELAREVGMSAFHLARSFADVFGEPPARYHRRLRLSMAGEALRMSSTPCIGEVASRFGYSEPSAFAHAFRREFGAPPGVIRRGGSPMPSLAA